MKPSDPESDKIHDRGMHKETMDWNDDEKQECPICHSEDVRTRLEVMFVTCAILSIAVIVLLVYACSK